MRITVLMQKGRKVLQQKEFQPCCWLAYDPPIQPPTHGQGVTHSPQTSPSPQPTRHRCCSVTASPRDRSSHQDAIQARRGLCPGGWWRCRGWRTHGPGRNGGEKKRLNSRSPAGDTAGTEPTVQPRATASASGSIPGTHKAASRSLQLRITRGARFLFAYIVYTASRRSANSLPQR